jgi:hypothetical protein
MSQLDKVLFTAGAVDLLRGRPMRRIVVLLGITVVVAYLARASGQEGGEGAQIFVDKTPLDTGTGG